MPHVPALRQPRRARRGPVGVYVAACVLIGAIVVLEPLRAEPIALGASAAEARAPGVAGESASLADALPDSPADELALPADVQPASAPTGMDGAETSSPAAAGKQAADAGAPQPAGPDKKTTGADGVARHAASPLTATATATATDHEMAGEEAYLEHDFKDAIRPVYDDLVASGVVDAVQGFRFYLAMLGVYLSNEHVMPSDQNVRLASVAEPYAGTTNWEMRAAGTDASLAPSEAQSAREKLIAAMIIEEWIAAVLPWIYGFIALLIAWQIGRLGYGFVRARSSRSHRRATRSHHRSADSARARARS